MTKGKPKNKSVTQKPTSEELEKYKQMLKKSKKSSALTEKERDMQTFRKTIEESK